MTHACTIQDIKTCRKTECFEFLEKHEKISIKVTVNFE